MKQGWDLVQASRPGQLSYKHSPRPARFFIVPGRTNEDEKNFETDAQAAYLHALQWVGSGDRRHAAKAIAILNTWGRGFQELDCQDEPRLNPGQCERAIWTHSAWAAAMFAPAAEIIRHFDGGSAGWEPQDIEQFRQFLQHLAHSARNYLYPRVRDKTNHAVSAAQALISVGVFNDDRLLYEHGLHAWRTVLPLVVVRRKGKKTAQLREFVSRKDCVHYGMTLLGASQAAEVAWHQGDDLYGFKDPDEPRARLEQALEHASLISRGLITVKNKKNETVDCTCTNHTGSGFETIYNHYKHRVSYPTRLSGFEAWAAECELRPDKGRPDFLSWSTLSHGDLSGRAEF